MRQRATGLDIYRANGGSDTGELARTALLADCKCVVAHK